MKEINVVQAYGLFSKSDFTTYQNALSRHEAAQTANEIKFYVGSGKLQMELLQNGKIVESVMFKSTKGKMNK